MALKRFVDGITGEAFFQKRAPDNRPDWLRVADAHVPVAVGPPTRSSSTSRAGLAWVANLGCIDLNPHPVRAEDLDHPDELRVDLDPVPGVPWIQVRRGRAGRPGGARGGGPRRLAQDHRARAASTSTSGSSRAGRTREVRRAALALARDVEARAPQIATSKWWKEERHGVFLDYNQNAKDRTVASAYSVRPLPDARVSFPLRWDEVADVRAEDFTIATVPALYQERGDAGAGHRRRRSDRSTGCSS